VRLLAVTNLYPPDSLGGYELACRDVVDGLRSRGHEIEVVTSTYGHAAPCRSRDVYRVLSWDPSGGALGAPRAASLLAALRNRRIVRRRVRRFRPSAVFIFNESGLGGALLDWLHSQPLPVAHDISDAALLTAYANDAWFGRLLAPPGRHNLRGLAKEVVQTFLRPMAKAPGSPLDLSRSYFRSQFLKDSFAGCGLSFPETPVIYHGVSPRLAELAQPQAARRGVVFSGRLIPNKGVEVLIRAVVSCRASLPRCHRTLSLVGPAVDGAYLDRLRSLADEGTPELAVDFLGPRTREEATALVASHAAFGFPVVWDEPFSIGLVEAMAVGTPVIATLTGGSREILRAEENCLAVEKSDVLGLAHALVRLLNDQTLQTRLSAAGRATAARFDLDRSIAAIEAHLKRVVDLPSR
jgi:glycogen(starch) synthase